MNKYKIVMEVIVNDDSMNTAIDNVFSKLYTDTLDYIKVISSEEVLKTDKEILFEEIKDRCVGEFESIEELLDKYEVKKK